MQVSTARVGSGFTFLAQQFQSARLRRIRGRVLLRALGIDRDHSAQTCVRTKDRQQSALDDHRVPCNTV